MPNLEYINQELEKIDEKISFFSTKSHPFFIPHLFINGIGEVPLPLVDIYAEKIKKMAIQAPFGKGSQTIVDTSVRNTWEIDASEITLKSDKWDKFLQSCIHTIKTDFGIENIEVDAALYKLLLYEKGSFFKKHQDTERKKGMFATLVIVLPCQYKGGEFDIFFDGTHHTIDFSDSPDTFNHIAFYADCEHAIAPLTAGYRLTLVYNLIKTQPNSELPTPTTTSHIEKNIFTFLNNINEMDFQKPLGYKLKHQYTPESFDFYLLKSTDTKVWEILASVASKLGWYCNMALVSHTIEGYPNDGDSDVIDEINEEYTTFLKWYDSKIPSLNGLEFKNIDFINLLDYENEEPAEVESTGYMGNYGPDVTYYYHHAFVFLSPFNILGNDTVVLQNSSIFEWIKYYLNSQDKHHFCFTLAEKLTLSNKKNLSMGDADPLIQLYIKYTPKYFTNPNHIQKVTYFFDCVSPQAFIQLYENGTIHQWNQISLEIFSKNDINSFIHWVLTLNDFNVKNQTFAQEIIEFTKSKIITTLNYFLTEYASTMYLKANNDLIKIFEILLANHIVWIKIEKDLLDAIEVNINRNLVDKVFVPIIKNKDNTTSSFYSGIYDITISFLKLQTAAEPEKPATFKRFFPKLKNIGKLENVLLDFCSDETKNTLEIKEIQGIRDNYLNIISNLQLDITHETIKKGSPHTLILTKSVASYERDLIQYKTDLKTILDLKQI